jgi:hypothetical protein
MSDPKLWVPCPACKGLRFAVLHEPKASLAHVLCEGCNRELLTVSMAPPEEPRVAVI